MDDGNPSGLCPYYTWLTLKKVTEELRLASPDSNQFQWMLGGFYTRESGADDQVGLGLTETGAIDPVTNPILLAYVGSVYSETALFGNATYKFNDRFDRYRRGAYRQGRLKLYGASSAGRLSAVPDSYRTSARALTDHPFTWLASSRLHLGPNETLYVRAATGYRAGGPNPTAFAVKRLSNIPIP